MTGNARIGSNGGAGTPPEGDGGQQHRLRRAALAMTWGPGGLRSPAARWVVNVLALVSAILIIVSAVIHLHLWAQGYSSISVIGPLFLAQGVVGILFAVTLGVFRWLGLMLAGAVLMAGTAVGLLLSAQIGLFGFKDSLAAPYAGLSLVVEFGGAGLLLAVTGLILAIRRSPARGGSGMGHALPGRPG
jgi:hypothetical protein